MKTRFLLVALAAVFPAIMAYAPPRLAAHDRYYARPRSGIRVGSFRSGCLEHK